MAKIKGVCKNYDGCNKADNKEIQEVERTAKFVCEECGKPLQELKGGKSKGGSKGPKPLVYAIIAVATLSILGGAGFGIYKLLTKEGTETTVTISPENPTVLVGETVKLTAKAEPEIKKWNWTSGDESVATVNDRGVVTGVSEGSVTITVVADDKRKASESVSVTVQPGIQQGVPVESIALNKSTLTLKENQSETLASTVLPENATNKNVEWSSSDDAIAKVENGTVTAVKKGQAVITAKSIDGSEKSAVCNVTVDGGTLPPTPPTQPLTYSCGDYKGETSSNGKAQGLGTFTYKARTLIDDAKMIYAERGDYITGTFRDDKIVSVRLYDSGGNLKQTIIPQQPASICR